MPYYAIIDHILTESRLQIALLTLILGEIDGSKITWKIILSFAWLVPLSETVQKSCWDLVKGDRGGWIEVTA